MSNDEFEDGSSKIDYHGVDNGMASSERDDFGIEDKKSDSSEDLDEREKRYKEAEKNNICSKVFNLPLSHSVTWSLNPGFVYSVAQEEHSHT